MSIFRPVDICGRRLAVDFHGLLPDHYPLDSWHRGKKRYIVNRGPVARDACPQLPSFKDPKYCTDPDDPSGIPLCELEYNAKLMEMTKLTPRVLLEGQFSPEELRRRFVVAFKASRYL